MIKVNRWFGIISIICVAAFSAQDVYSNNLGDNIRSLFKKESKQKKEKVMVTKSEKIVVDTISDIYEFSLAENIYSPLLQVNAKSGIKKKQQKLVDKLTLDGYNAELVRDGEVVMITIAAEKLFMPNSTELIDGAQGLITPLVEYAKVNGYYKVLLAMHSDDTGSVYYKDMLCSDRVEAVASVFDGTEYLVSYAQGDRNPLFDNKSVVNRSANRRLEIYFIPYKVMIVKGEKGNL